MEQPSNPVDGAAGHGTADAPLKIQLDRIEAVQARTRQVITDESLTDLEALVAEFGSRLKTVKSWLSQHPQARPPEQLIRLQEILTNQREIKQLIELQLTAMGSRLGNIKSARNINKTDNAGQPKNAAPLLRRDILG